MSLDDGRGWMVDFGVPRTTPSQTAWRSTVALPRGTLCSHISSDERQGRLASAAAGWRLLVAHESAIRGLDIPQVQVQHMPEQQTLRAGVHHIETQ